MNPFEYYLEPAFWRENRGNSGIPSARTAYGKVLSIAVPAVAETILISLINSVDMMMVGALGKQAISAIGLASQPRLIVLCFFTALNVGISALCARRRGEEKREEANETLRTAMVVALALSAVLLLLSLALTVPLMKLAGGSEETQENAYVLRDAGDYFSVIMYALPAQAIALAICAAQRGIGRTKITFYVNVLSNLINAVFNFLLIEGRWGFPRLEVRGAAIASDIGVVVGCVFALMTVTGKRNEKQFLHVRRKDSWRPQRETLAGILKIGGNAMIEQIGMRIGFFICGRIYFLLGTTKFAAHQIGMQILNLTFSFGDGLAVAATSLVGRNLGKKRPDLAVMYGKICQRCAVIVSLFILVLFISAREAIVRLYINGDTQDAAAVIDTAARTLVVLAFVQPFQINAFTVAGGLRGAADNLFVAVVASVCVTLVRPLMAYTAVYLLHLDLPVVWIMANSEMMIRCALFYPRFVSGKWANKKI